MRRRSAVENRSDSECVSERRQVRVQRSDEEPVAPRCRRWPRSPGSRPGWRRLLGLVGTAHPVSFTTVRGEVVDLFGAGIYRYDSVFSGAGNRGTDVVTLVIALPLLVMSVLGCRRGSLRWQLVLTGALAYFLYVCARVWRWAQRSTRCSWCT